MAKRKSIKQPKDIDSGCVDIKASSGSRVAPYPDREDAVVVMHGLIKRVEKLGHDYRNRAFDDNADADVTYLAKRILPVLNSLGIMLTEPSDGTDVERLLHWAGYGNPPDLRQHPANAFLAIADRMLDTLSGRLLRGEPAPLAKPPGDDDDELSDELSEAQKRILDIVKQYPGLTIANIKTRAKYGKTKTYDLLKELRERGLVILKQGWRVTSKGQRQLTDRQQSRMK